MSATLSRDAKIEKALSAVYAESSLVKTFDIDRDKIILFSDQHRGARNNADDFLPAERAYAAALDHYYAQGYTLIVLGDCEELWEERREFVVNAYRQSLASEARFNKDNRYVRLWGNHDDDWYYKQNIKKWLEPIYGSLNVPQSVRVTVVDRGKTLGEIFLTHGHQGTRDSDRFAFLSKFIVRFFWRPLQRLTKYSFNTPSKDFSLREHHDQSMYAWAAERAKTILIVGHTHRPVFKSKKHAAQLKAEIADLETQLKEKGEDSELLAHLNELQLKLEQVIVKDGQSPDIEEAERTKPCYFNTGCCCFPDGDITGIELANGEIRLVRWSSKSNIETKVLAWSTLRSVFGQL
jgi:UDP-2,3-diacylglucosamine pyrophosphatase LpxH